MRKYKISKEYKMFDLISPPFCSFFFFLSKIIGTSYMFFLKSTKQLKIEKKKLKENKKINLLFYRPSKPTDKVLFYIHGGAYAYKGCRKHFKLCKEYSLKGKVNILYVDYRLMPKYHYPIPLEDCWASYQWMIENYKKLGINLSKIILGGDSAGGCLSVELIHKINQSQLPKPCYQLLIYPLLDHRMQTNSMLKFKDSPGWNSLKNKKMWKMYLKDSNYLSVNEKTVKNFPPTYIETAEFDCLHDEAIDFCDKLKAEKIPFILNETKETMHGFDRKNTSITKSALRKRIEVLKKL